MLTSKVELSKLAAEVLDRVRVRHPRVHCITNTVAQAYTANMLLAAGAVPSMTITAEEVGAFVTRADAVLINLGTLDAERRAAIDTAITVANTEGRPWLLDPVFVERSLLRADAARKLVARHPRAIRLNQAEFEALASGASDIMTPKRYAQEAATVIGLTGDIDAVTDGARTASIANGHPLMARVTAMGCAASALNAAFLAVEDDAFLATAAALTVMGVAGEIAASASQGPGSFAIAILDAVYSLDRDQLTERARAS